MAETIPVSQIRQAICFATPGMSSSQELLLTGAEIFKSAYLFCRKIYLMEKDPVLFGAGSALDLFVPSATVQQVARFILGSLSLIRCSEDLHKLGQLRNRCDRIIDGAEYLLIKGDRFNIAGSRSKDRPRWLDEVRYQHVMRMARVSALFETIGEMFLVFAELMLHMGDAYVAYNEECGSEVFIHAKDLFVELTSDQSYLVQQLERCEAMNDWVFGRMNSPLSTQILVAAIALPSRVAAALPKTEDMIESVQNVFNRAILNATLNLQDMKTALEGTEPIYQNNRYYTYIKGGPDDPEMTRFITPPKRIRLSPHRT